MFQGKCLANPGNIRGRERKEVRGWREVLIFLVTFLGANLIGSLTLARAASALTFIRSLNALGDDALHCISAHSPLLRSPIGANFCCLRYMRKMSTDPKAALSTIMQHS